MSTFFERVRAALAPTYEIERELGSGGMGVVFLGRDTRLGRPVAIKTLRPEIASASAAERFRREAQILANLNHPNIVPVHDVDERRGISFYVMTYLEGESLASRLEKGSLAPADAVRICRDVLNALEAAHGRDVVHRDIKPANIVLVQGRAVLADFGIAKSLSDPSGLTAPGQPVGTLDYMPPEQAANADVTPRTDLYALAMVVYETITGRHWSILDRPEAADWRGVPRRLAHALRKALAWFPQERWADAAAFRRALWAPRPTTLVWPSLAVAGIAAAGAFIFCRPLGLCPALRPYQLMVEPFQVEGSADPTLGKELAFLVSDVLERFPRIRLVPPSYALERPEDSVAGRRLPPVHVVHRLVGTVADFGESLAVRLEVRDSLGRRVHSERLVGSARDKVDLADNVAFWVLIRIDPTLKDEYQPDSTLRGRNVAALDQFLEGEEAFRQDAWSEAERHFHEAWRLDSNFARAVWRLSNAQRWRRVTRLIDLRSTLIGKWRYLKPLDSLLVAAELVPTGEARFKVYGQALARYPDDPYARLLYGAELMHRGPLAGVPLDSGAAVLEEAVAQNPSLAPAHDQLIWSLIRLGRRVEARRALDRLEQIRRAPSPPDIDIVGALEVAFVARFTPESLVPMLSRMPPGVQQDVARTLRFALGFDVPAAQLALGAQLAAAPLDARRRASGHEAQALALVAMGRPAAALPHFDSAAALFNTATARLEALEWRVVPPALGVPGFPPEETERARGALARSPAARAAWALAVDAFARRDLAEGRTWRVRFQQRATWTAGQPHLDVLLAALEIAARGETQPALTLSARLLPFDESELWTDPFARAVLHVRRAQWFQALGRADGADREWLWYENTDFEGWLTGEVEASEIDWAIGVWGRWQRGAGAFAAGDAAAACRHLRRVLDQWQQAEPAYAASVAEARRLTQGCAP